MATWFVQNILSSAQVASKRQSLSETSCHLMEHTKPLHRHSADVGAAKEVPITNRTTRHRRGMSSSKAGSDANAGLAMAMCGSGYAGGAAAYYLLDRTEQ
ncbi:hypothetical protein K493DRAFT_24099 [Basidiobolus meristosporus CBS 931.73]|uniref:Uncharacterized protein n=1 Tax=Basidiobolus meristosporus CBS 931.73 TaxID=1314790 RepID=A0A1Y1YCF8_9FUNG|nr:hypothetical protein K493DRAFT_24099 [Basidiobolus meristosporus CBS 931.73]|eukprot:ORX95615.1 hypothetical protein K493DRAFT_24099 [Basidiobolus meristosporus CBS 931.73]